MNNVEKACCLIHATERKDMLAIVNGFAENGIFAQPYSLNGSRTEYRGRNEIQSAFQNIFGLIDKIGYEELTVTASKDENIVFIEVQGQMALAGSGTNYSNFYVFRFEFDEHGLVKKLTEYMNSYYLATIIGFPD